MSKKLGAEKLKKLINIGKEKGFLTYDELNQVLPKDMVSPERIEDILAIFEEMDIEVVERPEDYSPENKQLVADEKSAVESDVLKDDLDYKEKAADPVKMYLREMGMVSLLNREGEVEIAKRIEQGEQEVLDAILETSIGIREIIKLKEDLQEERISLKEVLRDMEDEYTQDEVSVRKNEVLKLLDEVAKLEEKRRQIQE
ncbi:MAG: RNA polymerase sigma factor RpoD, partial [Deltaproteobacteria bacterium]